ncbi:MAG: type II secretion system F family protein [Candidatus Omnitrophota bacterium]|nr:type II secretion system F family protein [Candidatus Omnitrophota bacterium]
MLLFIYFFIILAIALVVFALAGYKKDSTLKLNIPKDQLSQKRLSRISFLNKIPFTQTLLEKSGLTLKIKARLASSYVRISPLEFFNLKLLIVLGAVFFPLLLVRKFDPLITIVAIVFGYLIPDLYLAKRAKAYRDKISRVLPETVDLLTLCIETGLDFISAIKWVIEKTSSNPFLEELAFVLEEIKWGKSRLQALRDMSKRLNVPEVTSFVRTLVQAEKMGTPVIEVFTILADDVRTQRFHQGERYAMQAPIKILIPLVFCILPVIAIIIGGPIFLQFMQGGLLGGLGN